MSQSMTIDDIWKLFEETRHMFRESEEKSAREWQEIRRQAMETDRKLQESARQLLETDRQMQETDLKMKETDRQMKETDRQMKETDRQMKETDRKIKEVSLQLGRLGGRWGEFVEGLVAPACETLFAERGIPVHMVSRRITAKRTDGRCMEIDLLVVNTHEALLVEVKSDLKEEDVRNHLHRLAEFKEFFPYYADKRIMGAVAGIVVTESVARFAINQGLFVIVQSGDSVRLANDKEFTPKTW